VFEDLLPAWGGEEVVVRFDEPTATWMFVGVHSTVLGPAAGGTRMKTYAAPADGLRDVLRLSSAMTSKMAMASVPLGGGKAVLAVPEIPQGQARRELFLRYGDLVESNTAGGVFHGIRAAVGHAFGSYDLDGRTVSVQGVGAVGEPLSRFLAEAGARLTLADVDDVRAKELAGELEAEVFSADRIAEVECDVFSPCATGGVLNAETIPSLRCRVIAGAANNQLGEPADAERLAERGILYAPDYVVNAGGVIHLVGYEMLHESEAQVAERLRGIGATLGEVFARAEGEGVSTGAAADEIVAERLSAGRA